MLPQGTVTFFFADVEGSTRLVTELGADYPHVLESFRTVLADAIAVSGGHEIDARGDEVFAVFSDARGAVAAALQALATLEGVKVRFGLHTGTATLSDGSYFGLDVHRAARICSAGHGGQVLLSDATRAAVPDIAVSDLGEYRPKGLPEPMRLYQLVGETLVASFPPLRTDGPRSMLDTGAVRVVIADDSVLIREGTKRLLEEAGFDVVALAGDGDDLLLKIRSYHPDVAIVDIRMPPTHTDEGLRAAKEIRLRHPETGVLVLSQYVETDYALELLADNAEGVGYLLKDRIGDLGEFAGAVRRVAERGSALDPSIVSRLVGRHRGSDPLADLTPREREVLEAMAEGRSNKAIAARLVVTERAIEKHVTSIFGKLRLPASSEDHRRVLAVLAHLQG